MSHGLQELVRTTRESAGQVSAGSTQVAGAADESAKVSVRPLPQLKKSPAHARDEHQRAERREEHASSASSVAETSASIDNGHFHSARRRYR